MLELTGELTVAQVRELHAAICAVEPRSPVLEVHCGALTRLDAAAVQVLFAAAKSVEQPRVVAPPQAWTSAFSRYGLNDPFVPAS